MGEYYFKREQFHKDKGTEQVLEKSDQMPVAPKKVQEEKGAGEEQLFFSRDEFYQKSSPDTDKPEQSLSGATEPGQASKPEQQVELSQVVTGNDFTINLPKNWPGMVSYLLLGPQEEGEQLSIQVSVEEDVKAKSAAEYANQQIAVLKEHLPGCQILHQEEVSLTNGQKAYQVEFCWSPEENQQLHQQQVFVVSGGIGYKLTAIFPSKSCKAKNSGVDRILMSFSPESGGRKG